MLAEKIYTIITNGLETICKKYMIQKGIDTVIWYWTDDEGQRNNKILNNLL